MVTGIRSLADGTTNSFRRPLKCLPSSNNSPRSPIILRFSTKMTFPPDWSPIPKSEMEMVAARIQAEPTRLPDFGFQRNSIYLRFCHKDYHKGSALGELCRLEGISGHHVMAAGDHFNDLSMLDGAYAKMTACPANAIEPVKELVRRTEGYVAKKCWADGVAEALAFYGSWRMEGDAPAGIFREVARAYAPGLSR